MIFTYLFFDNMLERKHNRIIPITAMLFISICIFIARFFATEVFILHAVVSYALLLAYTIIFFKDVMWRKIASFVLMFIGCAFADVSALYIGVRFLGLAAEIDTVGHGATLKGLFLLVICDSIFFIFALIILIIWKRVNKLKGIGFFNAILFCAFPISQFCLLISMIDAFDRASIQLHTIVTAGVSLGVLADVVLFHTFFANIKKRQAETQLRELEQRRREEEVHYLAIEEKRSELSKIRHDFNNYISAAQALIDNRDFKSARELLEQLKNRVAENNQAGE